MRFPTVTVESIQALSLPLIGGFTGHFDQPFRPIDQERFKAKFGVTVVVAVQVWNAIISNLNEAEVPPKGYENLRPVHILYALFFMKCYPTVRQSVGTLGHNVGINNFRKYSYFVIGQIAGLSDEVVSNSKIDLICFI